MRSMTRYEEKRLEIERERNKLIEKLISIEQRSGKEHDAESYDAGYKAGYADAMKDSNYIQTSDPMKAVNMR